jgi:thymidine kinase
MLHIPLTLYLLLIKILGIIALFWGTNSTFAAVTKTNYHYLTMVVFSEDHIQETRRRGRIEVICGPCSQAKRKNLSDG